MSRLPRPLLALFAAALLFKLVLIVAFLGRLYPDVIGAVNLGKEALGGLEGYRITSKTFVGPLLWYGVYHLAGLWGLKLLNLALFAWLLVLHARLGLATFSTTTVLLASALFAFYPGTNLNVAVGEQDDVVTLLLFALGIVRFTARRDAFLPGLLMGTAFLFKFSAAVFCAGFVLFLLVRRSSRAAAVTVAGMALPFLLLNAVDGLASARNLVYALEVQQGFSSWRGVGFKLLSTGLLPSVLLSGWAWARRRDDTRLLLAFLPTAYLVYVILNRDAWAAGFVMMQGIFFSSFLLAELLEDDALRPRGLSRRTAIGGALAAYLLVSASITLVNAIQDTELAAERKGPWVLPG